MKNLLALIAVLAIAGGFFAFKSAPAVPSYEYSQVTTIESVVPGGAGRSRMLINEKGGTKDEIDMKNFFSLAGINFQNINNNELLYPTKMKGLNGKIGFL